MAAIGGDAGVRIAMVLGGAVQLVGAVVTLRWATPVSASSKKEVCHA